MVAAHGDLDRFTTPELSVPSRDALADGLDLTIDLTDTAVIDSSAIGEIVGLQKLATTSGVDMTVVIKPGYQYRLFEVTGLTEYLTLTASDGTRLD